MSETELFGLDGLVAIVSGGSGAIGSTFAAGLADAGAKVAVLGHSRERGDEVVSKIIASGAEAMMVEADATRKADCDRAVGEVVDRFGRVDVLVNAVGGGAGKVLFEAQEYPEKDWDWILDLNLRSTLLVTQPVVRSMIAAGGGGRIVNVTSVRGQLGLNAGYSAYVAAKGALNSLTRQWATEWAKYGIRVNGIAPTFVDTPQVAMLLDDAEFKAGVVARIPLGRVGETKDLLGAAVFFASPASSFVTGQILTIDGGLTATQ